MDSKSIADHLLVANSKTEVGKSSTKTSAVITAGQARIKWKSLFNNKHKHTHNETRIHNPWCWTHHHLTLV
jgi:hypothetical protein